MAKRVRELNGNNNELTFSSGVTVDMLPFPAGMWEEINIKAFEQFPDPVPPKKTIKALGGTEEVDDLEDPEYKASVEKVGKDRTGLLLEAVLDICPQLDLVKWEPRIKRLEKYTRAFSEDPDDRRIEFLTRYVLRTKSDYENLMLAAVSQILVDDPEVSARIQYFQSQVEGAATPYLDAPGASEGERVEVSQASEGA
jgi:hypothetical protein